MESKDTNNNDRVIPCDDDESTNSSSDNLLAKAAVGIAVGAVGLGAAGEADAFWIEPSRVIMPAAPAPCTGACAPQATGFQTIIDKEARTRFRRMDWSTPLDWLVIANSTSNLHKINTHNAIINLLNQCARYSFGMRINVLQHCLQTATRAARAGASDELVLGALLHDVGIAISYPGHAQISASIIRTFVSDDVYKTVLHHHEFELAHYGHRIGQSTTMRNLYVNEPWYPTATKFVDEWVQVSYDPGYASYSLQDFIPLIKREFAEFTPEKMEVTMSDCFREQPV